MNDFAGGITGAEMRWITNDTIIEARTNRDQHIAMLHGHVGFNRTMHAKHAQKLLVRGRVCTQAHQRICTGVAQQAHQLGYLR